MDTERLNVITIAREDGVSNLPVMVRALFAKALKAERNGDYEAAQNYLDQAISKEAEISARK